MAGFNLAEALDWIQVISTLPLLQELHLSSCWLSQIPGDPTIVSFTSLIVLDLSSNIFDSLLPGWIFSLHNLESLDLTIGLYYSKPSSILNGLFSLSYLRFLDVSNCNISGPVLGNLQNFSLIILDLSLNDLFRNIPTCFTNFNVISGRLSPGSPTLFYEITIDYKQQESAFLMIKGRVSSYNTILNLVREINLSDNNLSGPIPSELGTLKGLRYLNLSRNDLSSSIPETIDEMGLLESLDLSVNRLNGKIPMGLSRFTLETSISQLSTEVYVEHSTV
ncbi:leucine-rich repeat protein [Tanacetum coccineum]